MKEDLVILPGLVKNLLFEWEAVQAAYNVSRGSRVSRTGIQGPVCPHKVYVSVFGALKELIEDSLESLFNLGWIHHFRDPPGPDILPPCPIIKVL